MTGERPASYRAWPWFAALAGLLFLDQLTKYLVRANLTLYESIPLLGEDLIRLTYIQNPGIAFGLTFLSLTVLLIFGWTAAVFLAVYLFRLVRRHDPLRWPVMLFLAGAVGNSIDRTLYGKVTDYLDADFPDFIMKRWPIFNVADSCITIGIVLMIWITLFERGRSHNSHTSHERLPDTPDSLSDQDRAGPTPASD
jgi:signal peptidase II